MYEIEQKYKLTTKGLYKPTKAQKIKEGIKKNLLHLNSKLEKDRQNLKKQSKERKQKYEDVINKINIKRKNYERVEKKAIYKFRNKTSKKLLRRFRL